MKAFLFHKGDTMIPICNGKEIEFTATKRFNDKYGGIEVCLYIKIALLVLQKYPVDMLVFEMTDSNHQQVRLAGYDFNTNVLDEKTVAYKTESLPTETFWLKIDNYQTHYVGTFLFPDEY
jgi:hypothetical protein